MSTQKTHLGLLMFVVGLFSETQIQLIGSIGISELVMVLCSPFFYFFNLGLLRRDGVLMFVRLIALALIGCVISSLYNDISLLNFMRGFATPFGWLASCLFFYPVVRRDPKSFAWYLLGGAFSAVLTTFVFHGAYEMLEAESRGGGSQAIMEGAIYWTGRIRPFVNWPIEGFYMKTPVVYSVAAPAIFAVYALMSTASGRSQALLSVASVFLIAFIRKDVTKMKALRRHVVVLFFGGLVCALAFKAVYSHLAVSGHLGEIAKAKYESQTRGGTSAFELLREGRGELFRGMYYCAHHPIMGYGPWAIDKERLYVDYVEKYGVGDDYLSVVNSLLANGGRYVIVGAHSAMLQFWLAYGILGMPVWIYVFYLIYDFFTKRIGAVPELYGYFAIVLPSVLWEIFFSPFGNRLHWGLVMAMLLLNRSIARDRKHYQCLS